MRIQYLFVWNDFASGGVPAKVATTARAWSALGADVRVDLLTRSDEGIAWLERERDLDPGRANAEPTWNGWTYASVIGRDRVLRAALRSGEEAEADIVFSRFDTFLPGWLRSAHANDTKRVFEVNTDDVEELPSHVVRRAYHLATRRLMLRAADGFTFVSRELREAPSFRRVVQPSIVLGNGVSFDDLAWVDGSIEPGASPRLFFIGTKGLAWHGVDEILWLAGRQPDWTFDVVGEFAADWPTAPANVRFHGTLQPSAYRHLLAAADVAIGTLALHRKGMSEASPLKVREYLAAGKPTIIGYEDTDFPDGAPFLLRLANEPGAVQKELTRIRTFVRTWAGRSVARVEVAHLDVRRKEQERLAFFERLASGPDGGAG